MSSKKQQKEVERQLIELINSKGNNNKCGECGTSHPTWASYNLGMFLCGRCAAAHKKVLGSDISKVKSLTLDSWTEDRIASIRRVGNSKSRRRWNPKRVPFPYDADDNPDVVDQYFKDKYILGKFSDDNLDEDYKYSDDSESLAQPSSANRSRLGSYLSSRSRLNSYVSNGNGRSRSGSSAKPSRSNGNVPRLTHRKLTTFENTLYTSQVAKIMKNGYNDRDAVLESLLLSTGIIDFATEILEEDLRVNPSKNETAPDLPRRPVGRQQTAAITGVPSNQTITPKDDWWSKSNAATAVPSIQIQPTGPQIYQYTDPITGQVSYVDDTGQQYLDPSNPQHQQQLFQASNPQLVAQQTNKQSILNLYGQPTGQQLQLTGQQQSGQLQPQQPGQQQQQQQQQQLQQQQLQQQQLQQQQLQQQQLQQQLTSQPTAFGFGTQVPQYTAQTGYYQPPQQQQSQFTGFQNQQTGFGYAQNSQNPQNLQNPQNSQWR